MTDDVSDVSMVRRASTSPAPQRALLSARVKLTLSYAAFVMVVCAILMGVVAMFVLRYVPDDYVSISSGPRAGHWAPNRDDLVRAFVPRAAQGLALCLLIGLAGGWFLAGRMLRPLHALSDAAEQVAAGSLSHRVRYSGPQDEFGHLAYVFDTMLDRLADLVRRQERFAANASHELRTPLAASRALIETVDPEDSDQVRDLLARLERINAQAGSMTEALLTLSRVAPEAEQAEDVDLSVAAEDALETLLPLAAARGVAMKVDGEAASTRGSRSLIEQLVVNVVHNAIVHNRPSDGQVLVNTTCGDGRAVLTVTNTGPRVPAESLEYLTEPFQTAQGRTRHATDAGTGLGLSIVQAIVDLHGAALDLDAPESGGLRVRVSFRASDGS